MPERTEVPERTGVPERAEVTAGSAIPTPSVPLVLLVTGARGQVGTEVLAAAGAAGVPVRGVGSAELDITDAAAVRAAVARFAESAGRARAVVINTAGYTAVDAAETDADRAFAVNATAPGVLAAAAAAAGVGLIHLSTDYVFSGDGIAGNGASGDGRPRDGSAGDGSVGDGRPRDVLRPYEVDDPTGPRSVYGASKLAGEQAVRAAHPGAQVVRTAWVYGAAGTNFVKTMARLEATRDTIGVVDDQIGSPTYAADLAAGLVQLALLDRPGGVLHATGGGRTSWCGFARAVFTELGADPHRVGSITSAEFVSPAPRPAFSVLSDQSWRAAGLAPLPDWRAALSAALAAHRDAFTGVSPAR